MRYKNDNGKKNIKIGFFSLTASLLVIAMIIGETVELTRGVQIYTEIERAEHSLALLIAIGFMLVLGKKDKFINLSWGKKKEDQK